MVISKKNLPPNYVNLFNWIISCHSFVRRPTLATNEDHEISLHAIFQLRYVFTRPYQIMSLTKAGMIILLADCLEIFYLSHLRPRVYRFNEKWTKILGNEDFPLKHKHELIFYSEKWWGKTLFGTLQNIKFFLLMLIIRDGSLLANYVSFRQRQNIIFRWTLSSQWPLLRYL